MSNVKSLDALDINGLAIFKENIVKKYLTQGEAPSIIAQAVYKALQSYKKDVVQFYSSYFNLPIKGNPGTLYLVHKSVDKEHTDAYKNTIWFSVPDDLPKLTCEFSSGYAITLLRDPNGYFILDLNDVDPDKVSYLYTYTTTRNTVSLYKPNTRTYISSYDDLVEISGNIVSTTASSDSTTLILPRLEYEKDIPEEYRVPEDEIWVLYDYADTLSYKVGNYKSGTILNRNKYGYFVLKKNVHFPGETGIRIYQTTLANSYYLYPCIRNEPYSYLDYSEDMHKLCGSMVALPGIAAYPLFGIYPYDRRKVVTHMETISDSIIPDNEIWFDSNSWSSMFVSFNGADGEYTELTKNEQGYYVLSKEQIDSISSITSMHLGTKSSGNTFNSSDASGSIVKTLPNVSDPGNYYDISSREQIYEFLGKTIHIVRGYNTPLVSSLTTTVDTSLIPTDQVWIDGTSFGDVDILYVLQSEKVNTTTRVVHTMYKNKYGYFELPMRYISPNQYILFGSTSSGYANSTITQYLKYNTGDNEYWLTKTYLQVCTGKIITTAPNSIFITLVNKLGTQLREVVEYVDQVISPEDTSDNKFVTYTYENNKYVQVGSSIFDTSDLHLEEITDQVLSLTSTNAISNKAFCDALRYKYSIANILATPVNDYDNIVSSNGIKAAIDRLVTWEDIDCIPITEEEIRTLFSTYKPITLEQANYYRIVIRGKKSDGANYLTKIFDTETLIGLTFMSRSEDGPSMSEKLSFVEDDTGRYIPVTITCANKYNSPSQFWPGNLFDDSSDGYYRADTSDDDMVLTIDIKRKLSMSTLRKLTFRCLAGRPYQNTIPPVEKLYVSTYGSIGGVDYPTFRENVIYTPDKVANDGAYTIDIFPNA
jgi:hypothetical protein